MEDEEDESTKSGAAYAHGHEHIIIMSILLTTIVMITANKCSTPYFPPQKANCHHPPAPVSSMTILQKAWNAASSSTFWSVGTS